MRKSVIIISSALFLLTSVASAASLKSLTQKEITDEFGNKSLTTIPIVTMNGHLMDNTVMAFIDKDGKLIGQFATNPDNDPKDDTGKWAVSSEGTFCATWDHWNQSKPICTDIYKVDNGFVFVNHDTHKLETIVLSENVKEGNQLVTG